jgi:hypothetical protein
MARAPFRFDLSLAVGCDGLATVTVLNPALAQLGVQATSAELAVRITAADPAPVFTVSTVAGASGSLVFGATFPPPAGIVASNEAGLSGFTFGTNVSTEPPPLAATVANVAALATLPTSSFQIGSGVFVQTPGVWYVWSPSDPSTPSSPTVIAGVGGNWLLAGTLTVAVSAASSLLLAGYSKGVFDVVLTWADGTKTRAFEGSVWVAQASP